MVHCMCGDDNTVHTFRSTIVIADLNFQLKVFQILVNSQAASNLKEQTWKETGTDGRAIYETRNHRNRMKLKFFW
jgi:hypothetical protein